MVPVTPERLERALSAIRVTHPDADVALPAESWEVGREGETWVYVNDRPFASLSEGASFTTFVVVFAHVSPTDEPRSVKAFPSRKGADSEETLP
jgi:hypothetical protein